MIATLVLAAHIFTWSEAPNQIGVAIDNAPNEHLIFFIKGSCQNGMQIKGGRPGDFDAAATFLKTQHFCDDMSGK